MSTKNKQGKTLKEINSISERLHGSGNSNTIRLQQNNTSSNGGKQPSKEEIEAMVQRLHEKDPNAKRKELQEKHDLNTEKERPDNLGWQKASKEDVNSLTSRLFIADYTNRNVGKQNSSSVKDKEMTKEEFDAAVERLFVSDYSNKNITKNQQFYDLIMNKKKAEEKTLTKEEWDEAVARLSKMTRDPASCNKEMLGKKTYTERGIYGTYAMNGGNPTSTIEQQKTLV